MREIIRKVPIPTAGVALGLAALGNLLQPYTEIVHIVCGILSLVLIAMLGAKIALFPDMIRWPATWPPSRTFRHLRYGRRPLWRTSR